MNEHRVALAFAEYYLERFGKYKLFCMKLP